MTSGPPPRGLLFVFLTAGISGVSAFVNVWAVQGANTDAFLAARNGLVALLLLPAGVFAIRGMRARLRRSDWARLFAIGVVGGAIPFLLFFRGLQLAGAEGVATASFGYRALFLVATLFAIVFLRERPSPQIAAAAGLLLAGNALVLSLFEPVWTDGFVLVMAATVLWAGEYTISKRTLRELPAGVVALSRMGIGALALFAFLVASGQAGELAAFSSADLQWIAISAFLLLGFVSTWYAGLAHVDLSVATSVLVLGFPITLGLSALSGRAGLDPGDAAGLAAIVAGVVVAVGVAGWRDTWTVLSGALLRHARGVR